MTCKTPLIDLSSLRADFPMLKRTMHGHPFIYLDSAATAHKPEKVIKAVQRFYQDEYATVLRAVYELAETANRLYQEARCKAQSLINAPRSEEIIFTRGTTDAINLVAYSFGKAFVNKGDVIMITEMEHHSNLVPWQIMCEDRGAQLAVAPINADGDIDLNVLHELLTTLKPKLLAITHVSNVLGTLNPIKQITKMAHEAGAKVLVDGAQSISHIPVDVQDLDVDFFTFSGHKIYGPTGVGILYGKKELLEIMPPAQGGGSMVDTVTFEKTTYNMIPWKFEAGTMMLAEIIGLAAAIDYVQDVGFKAIQSWEKALMAYALERMQRVDGLHIIGQPVHRESVISFTVDGVHPLDIATMLDLKGIAIRTGHHCAQPLLRKLGHTSTSRISWGIYNNQADVDAFIDAITVSLVKLR